LEAAEEETGMETGSGQLYMISLSPAAVTGALRTMGNIIIAFKQLCNISLIYIHLCLFSARLSKLPFIREKLH